MLRTILRCVILACICLALSGCWLFLRGAGGALRGPGLRSSVVIGSPAAARAAMAATLNASRGELLRAGTTTYLGGVGASRSLAVEGIQYTVARRASRVELIEESRGLLGWTTRDRRTFSHFNAEGTPTGYSRVSANGRRIDHFEITPSSSRTTRMGHDVVEPGVIKHYDKTGTKFAETPTGLRDYADEILAITGAAVLAGEFDEPYWHREPFANAPSDAPSCRDLIGQSRPVHLEPCFDEGSRCVASWHSYLCARGPEAAWSKGNQAPLSAVARNSVTPKTQTRPLTDPYAEQRKGDGRDAPPERGRAAQERSRSDDDSSSKYPESEEPRHEWAEPMYEWKEEPEYRYEEWQWDEPQWSEQRPRRSRPRTERYADRGWDRPTGNFAVVNPDCRSQDVYVEGRFLGTVRPHATRVFELPTGIHESYACIGGTRHCTQGTLTIEIYEGRTRRGRLKPTGRC
jgi:hypothetical protein